MMQVMWNKVVEELKGLKLTGDDIPAKWNKVVKELKWYKLDEKDIKHNVSIVISSKAALKPATTEAWDILHITREVQESIPRDPTNIVIGIVDSGLCPEIKCINPTRIVQRKRFNHHETDDDITDTRGHGTKCASIIAGDFDESAHYHHLKIGTGRGGLPSADLAVYKVQNRHTSEFSEAISSAINDGVDVLSVSLGLQPSDEDPKFGDPISVSTFRAIESNILCCLAAGNWLKMIDNVQPWAMTVNGCDSKSEIVTRLHLVGWNDWIEEHSLNIHANTQDCELVHFLKAAKPAGRPLELDKGIVRGKLVVYEGISGNKDAKDAAMFAIKAKAAGMIIILDTDERFPKEEYSIATIVVSKSVGKKILDYMGEEKSPALAKIYQAQEVVNENFPSLADFAARGANMWCEHINEPNLCAMGRDILCAVPQKRNTSTTNSQDYVISSGTSYSTAIVSAAIGFVKAHHRDWTFSEIRSALMTTCTPMNFKKYIYDIQWAGNGLINPRKALEPGLLYNITPQEYCNYVYSIGGCSDRIFDEMHELNITPEYMNPWDLNMPSFKASFRIDTGMSTSDMVHTRIYKRRVRYVGEEEEAVFRCNVKSNNTEHLKLNVTPDELVFRRGEGGILEATYELTVTVKGWNPDEAEVLSGLVEWIFEKYHVRSPVIVVRSKQAKPTAGGKASRPDIGPSSSQASSSASSSSSSFCS